MCECVGGGVVTVNPSPVQECTLRSTGFHLYESSGFLEEKKNPLLALQVIFRF